MYLPVCTPVGRNFYVRISPTSVYVTDTHTHLFSVWIIDEMIRMWKNTILDLTVIKISFTTVVVPLFSKVHNTLKRENF